MQTFEDPDHLVKISPYRISAFDKGSSLTVRVGSDALHLSAAQFDALLTQMQKAHHYGLHGETL